MSDVAVQCGRLDQALAGAMRLEVARRWCVTGLWLPWAWVLVGAPLLLEYAAVWLGGVGAVAAVMFDWLAALFMAGWLCAMVLALVLLPVRMWVERGMQDLAYSLPGGWHELVRVTGPAEVGLVRLRVPGPGVVELATTPVSWALRGLLAKGFAASMVVFIGFGIAVGPTALRSPELLLAIVFCVGVDLVGLVLMTRVTRFVLERTPEGLRVLRTVSVMGVRVRGGGGSTPVKWDPGVVEIGVRELQRDHAWVPVMVLQGLGLELRGFSAGRVGLFQARVVGGCLSAQLGLACTESGEVGTRA
ncbi:MAG: hypothetical protein U0637_15300 [Phycisphaerales bacterium]